MPNTPHIMPQKGNPSQQIHLKMEAERPGSRFHAQCLPLSKRHNNPSVLFIRAQGLFASRLQGQWASCPSWSQESPDLLGKKQATRKWSIVSSGAIA